MTTTGRTTPTSKTKKPTVHFDIAQAEAEVDEEIEQEYVEPFKVKAANGTDVTFADPRTLDVFVAATLDSRDPYTTFRQLIVDDEEYNAFMEKGFKPGVNQKLLNAYQEHYKGLVTDLGN